MELYSHEATWPKFLDPEDVALIILLKTFIAGGRRGVSEPNVDDISVILVWSAQDCHLMDASWWSGAGKLYVHRVESASCAGVRARFDAE